MASHWRIFEKTSVAPRVFMLFTRQLATLVDSGFPLLEGLAILNRQEKDLVLRKVIAGITESIRNGETFSESLVRYPAIFDKFFINMVRAGEVGGVLAETLLRLAEFQEKAHKLRNKVRAATAYPCTVLMVTIAIVCFLLGVIIPKFQSLLPDILGDRPLPALTIFVSNLGKLFQYHFPGLLGACLLLLLGSRYVFRLPRIKYLFDSWKLKVPLVGNLSRQYALSSFSRTLGILTSNSVPILQGLILTRETVRNSYIAAAIDQVRRGVQAGEPICHSLAILNIFPPLVVSMISVGEETGRLPQMLLKIADIYDDDIENTLSSLTSLIEPVIVIFLAIAVGIIIIALFSPIISITTDFSTP